MSHDDALAAFDGTIHLVFSSHWDREWYEPFQKFRAKLVRNLDEVFDHLESGALPIYQMDGQFVPVEDYLQIRPEREALVRQMIADGRFVVGPWYDLPDEFLVSGESVTRNFLLGMKRSEIYGQTSRAGWLCDIFGHNSQTPQVLQQLGIDNVIAWRGIDTRTSVPFQWEGADGTRVLAHRFGHDGYCDFDFHVRRSQIRDEVPTPDELLEKALAYFQLSRQEQEKASDLLWFDGGDHLDFDPAILELVKQFNEKVGREMIRVSTLDAYMKSLRADDIQGTDVVKGELREPARQDTAGWMIPGVSSSRIDLKRANHAGETLLTLWAEPWCAEAARLLGLDYPATSLELAWEYLLKNHPHDSICGCSIDETHNAMPYRSDQSRQLCEVYLQRAFEALSAASLRKMLSKKVETRTEEVTPDIDSEGPIGTLDEVKIEVEEKAFGFSLFAPAGGSAQVQPETFLKLPAGWPQFNEWFGFESKPAFRIFGENGEEVPYQLLQVVPNTTHIRVDRNKFPGGSARQGVRLALDTTLQAGEARHFRVERFDAPTRYPLKNFIGTSRDTLRNDKLEVCAHHDGTLSVKDLKSGREYSQLLQMEDSADIGDGWYHGQALQDIGVLSTGGHVTFGVTENGPLLARLKIRVEWLVPHDFDFKSFTRSRELAPLVVEHLVTLRKDSDLVEIETTVHNTVRDHRLRVFCPTDFTDLKTYFADTPFDVVQRNVALRDDNHELRELQIEMSAQQNFVAASTREGGLALLAPGQYESAVLDEDNRPLCMTLLRGFRRTVMTDGEEGGQILGSHTIRMGIKPFAAHDGESGEILPANELLRDAQSLAAPVKTVFLDAQDLANLQREMQRAASTRDYEVEGETPAVSGDAVLSARYQTAPNVTTLRLFNAETQPRELQLSGGKNWTRSNMRGENAEAVSSTVTLKPKEIVTLNAQL